MTEILEAISGWSIFKWVTLVLIAGFIGQFGRMLAESIAGMARRQREEKRASRQSPADGRSAPPQTVKLSDQAKKDLSPPRIDAPALMSSGKDVADYPPDKKMLKALAKIKKKEAKKQYR